ncbi:pseudohemocyanin-2-like [Procambarus clarkii]|uniref:pseudohemocyanin-2-like n=1 Tax=Procambarus clarkii TaxID=6728 RepID=UPI0037423D18
MKVLVVFALVAAASAFPFIGDYDQSGFQRDESDGVALAQKQHDINFLFYKVYEPLHDTKLKDLADNFNPEAKASNFPDGGIAIQKLLKELKDHHLEERGDFFTVFNCTQREQAMMLANVLMQCQDWTIFTSYAAYFRQRMNEEEFVYAMYAAVAHSPLTRNVVLPPMYEIMPHFYTSSEVLQQAYKAKMTAKPGKFPMDFTGTQNNPEYRVAYFTEDIGLSTHYLNWHIDYPFWWNDTFGSHIERKGETFFWVHHQLNNRFDAERLSNHLHVVEKLHWDKTLHEGFHPHTSYKYGHRFPIRDDYVHIQDVDNVAEVYDLMMMDQRIRDAIAHGYITDKDGSKVDIMNEQGIDILGNIIESSMYSPNADYYGSLNNLGQVLLGHQGDPHDKYHEAPSVLEHYETATRDPAFYQLHKYIDDLFRKHKDRLPPYNKEELEFQGVAINSINIDGTLETYLEDYEYSLVNAVDDKDEVENVDISTFMPRLMHKDFSFNIDIMNNNDAEVLATIRIFAWPLRDSNGVIFPFNEGRWHAIELDRFWKTLTPGNNHIVRKSVESTVTVPDVPSIKTLQDMTEAALNGGTELHLEQFVSATGLPNRLLIPKGNEAGMEFKLVVAVTDGTADAAIDNLETLTKFHHYGYKGVYPDKKPHGYPLDRRVPDERVFHEIPNFAETIVKVYNHDQHIQHH